jgi:UDP-2-acetamido-2-deoxy-ribo-hexuluronate aminotransferase
MKVLFDVNIVVDICCERYPYSADAVEVLSRCKQYSLPVYLYAGSVQTLHYAVASQLNSNSSGSFSESLKTARDILSAFSSELQWWPALSYEAGVFEDEDPEDAQLMKAVLRMGPDSVLLTRDEHLLQRCSQAISPKDLLEKFSNNDSRSETAMQFCDLSAQLDTFRPEMEREILDVVESTKYIKGPPLGRLETELSDYLEGGRTEAVGCASGTDALLIALMALEVQPGDEIIVPDFTFIATGEAVAFLGAVPVFCDVDPVSYNLDPTRIESHITEKTVGIIPVSIFGQPADMDRINSIAETHGLWVMEDAAQSFGATYKGRNSGTLTKVATTSFFPAKPLGCYGDGGAIFTNDSALANTIRVILNHGQTTRYHHSKIGLNGRMDSLQAAVVSVKLRHFKEELEMRQEVARKYTERLEDLIHTPVVLPENSSSWAQYTVQHEERDKLRELLQSKGIPTAVHYPIPLHKQEAFAYLRREDTDAATPVTERLSERVFSLPMHPYLKDSEIDRIAETIAPLKSEKSVKGEG